MRSGSSVRPRSARLFSILLALASTTLALAGLELATRLAGLHYPSIARPADGGTRALWVHDSELGWYHRPGTKGEDSRGGPDAGQIRINALGLRGPDPELGQPSVVVLGDSFAFGVGVDEPHLMTSELGRRLAALGQPAPVVNAGVSGYSTDQSLLLFRRLAPRLHPRLVVLVLCDNDLEGNAADFAYGRYYKPYFALAGERLGLHNVPVPQLSPGQQAKLWLAERSNLWNFVRSRSAGPPLQGLLDWFQVAVPRLQERPMRLTRYLVRELRDAAGSAGAGLLVASTGRRGEPTDVVRQLFARLEEDGVATLLVDLETPRRADPGRPWDFPGDAHWNVAAHAEVAAQLAPRVAAMLGLPMAAPASPGPRP
jgi:hypothetical protein